VRPRRIWEQQQMKTVVPITACSTEYDRAAAPRAAPTCPGESLVAGRAVSEHSHGKVAASEAVATCPTVRVCHILYVLTVFLALAQMQQQLQGLLPVLVICLRTSVSWRLCRPSPRSRAFLRRVMLHRSARAERGEKPSSALFDGCCFVSHFVTGPCCFNALTRWYLL